MIEENTVLDIRQLFIKNINEELQRLTVEELDKVYKFTRTNIIANIKEQPMKDESLSSLDEYVQNLTRAEYEDALNQEYENGKRDGYHEALNDKFRYFHIWWWIKSMLRGRVFCSHCGKIMWVKRYKTPLIDNWVCSEKCAYAFQLATRWDSDVLYYRTKQNDTWEPWKDYSPF